MGNQKLVILGAGESGTGAALLAKHYGFDVFVSDLSPIKQKFKDRLLDANILFEEGQHTEAVILSADEIIKSPGIPSKSPIVKKIVAANISLVDEIEFASRYTNAKMICITGSNGKTTTTLLTHHILKKAGYNVGLAGNVGKSLAMHILEDEVQKIQRDYFVLELSSFQLDGLFNFKADISVLLNITPDHLDRYDYQLTNYAASKFRITQNQSASEIFIYCQDDPILNQELKTRKIPANTFSFSLEKPVSQGAYVSSDEIHLIINQTNQTIMSIHELALQGKHNMYNSMAAGRVARLTDVRKEIIRESLADFQNVEHRLEFVAKVHGVEFINDSKATNVNSTWYALDSMQNKVVLILGGVDKGNDYSSLVELAKEKVKAIICLGVDNKKIISVFSGLVPAIVETTSAKEAVMASCRFAKKGDTVLLSPACASFDLFDNYEDRGHQYKAAVRAL